MKDLSAHRIIGHFSELILMPDFELLAGVSLRLTPQLTSSNIIAQMRATAGGGGVCILPTYLASEDDRLIPVLPDVVKMDRTFWLTIHADLRHTARIRVVVDFLVDAIERERAIFTPDRTRGSADDPFSALFAAPGDVAPPPRHPRSLRPGKSRPAVRGCPKRVPV